MFGRLQAGVNAAEARAVEAEARASATARQLEEGASRLAATREKLAVAEQCLSEARQQAADAEHRGAEDVRAAVMEAQHRLRHAASEAARREERTRAEAWLSAASVACAHEEQLSELHSDLAHCTAQVAHCTALSGLREEQARSEPVPAELLARVGELGSAVVLAKRESSAARRDAAWARETLEACVQAHALPSRRLTRIVAVVSACARFKNACVCVCGHIDSISYQDRHMLSVPSS